MISKYELDSMCAESIKKIRLKHKMSKSKMADFLYIDDHTYANYESGRSTPTVTEFITLFNAVGENPMKAVMEMLYPGSTPNENIDDYRQAIIKYFEGMTAEHNILVWYYLIFGSHGSSVGAQSEMLCMIDHLPMQYRFAVAHLVDSLYDLAESRGEMTNTEDQMPCLERFHDALQQGEEAAKNHRNAYSAIIER